MRGEKEKRRERASQQRLQRSVARQGLSQPRHVPVGNTAAFQAVWGENAVIPDHSSSPLRQPSTLLQASRQQIVVDDTPQVSRSLLVNQAVHDKPLLSQVTQNSLHRPVNCLAGQRESAYYYSSGNWTPLVVEYDPSRKLVVQGFFTHSMAKLSARVEMVRKAPPCTTDLVPSIRSWRAAPSTMSGR